jgi:hypothetical protein
MMEKNKFATEGCTLCKESSMPIGKVSEYGACTIYKKGNKSDGWFATLSPKTVGDPEHDFSIQIIPIAHLKNFGEINSSQKLAENYGKAFAIISGAVAKLIKFEKEQNENESIPICTYGKCKHPDEHIHIKIFPYRGDLAQPFVVDSTFEKKEVFSENSEKFVKLKPITKKNIPTDRFQYLKDFFIKELKNEH